MTRQYPAVEERLARHLADKDGWIIDDNSWEDAPASLRTQYRAMARELIVIVKGPTIAAQAIANMGAEIRELTKQRDRYREAWRSACRGRTKSRRAAS